LGDLCRSAKLDAVAAEPCEPCVLMCHSSSSSALNQRPGL
jgi:hypothetical protein